MSTTLLLDLTAPRQWQLDVLRRLAQAGRPVRARHVGGGAALPGAVERLFTLEAMLHRLPRPGAMSAADRAGFAPYLAGDDVAGGLTIDLCGAGGGDWQLVVDGRCGLSPEAALAAAALARQPVEIALLAGGQPIAAARPGTENGGVALAACEDWLARLQTLIVAAVDGARPLFGALPDGGDTAPAMPGARDAAERALKALAAQAVRLLYRLLTRSPHWRIGWRTLDGPDVYDLGAIPPGWRDLPDDGLRFYADPFFAVHGGETALFMEEFPHRTARGVISAVRFGADGPLGTPEPVLDTGSHLSYPHVFARDGALWMIPESCAANGIDLYRCTRFPGGWQHHARLVDGVVASDATLVEAEGLLWLFATVRDGGGAYSDALHLWWAERLDGPWTAHRGNPVLIDIASARPAGAFVRRGGALLRPVQDCRRGYGAALAVARVSRLDREGFAQQVEAQLAPGPNWRGRRLHTLNAGGGFEAIDGSALMPRLRLGRRRAPPPRDGR